MIKLALEEHKFIIPQETDCIEDLKNIIVKNKLYKCKCGSKEYYWKSDKLTFECKSCKVRKSAKSFSDILHNSNLKLSIWISIIHLSCLSNNPSQIKKILNYKKYSTIWDKTFIIQQEEKRYQKTRINRANEINTNIQPLSNISIYEQVSLFKTMSSKKYISSRMYWEWFLKIN